MDIFFYIAGVVVTIIGIVAIGIISGVYVAVCFFGMQLTFGYKKDEKDTDVQQRRDQ